MDNLEQLIARSDTLKHMGLKVVEQTTNALKIFMPQADNRNHLSGKRFKRACYTVALVD